MSEKTARPFVAKIVDFNPTRMSDSEAANIPEHLRSLVGDKRQYPFNIAKHFPNGVSWFSPDQPWFFRYVMSNPDSVAKINQSDTLILSGSGMSAYHFQEKNYDKFKPEDVEYLKTTQEIVRNQLGTGKWVLGICFGGQVAVGAVGGRIGRLPTKENGQTVTEAGWLDQSLTEAGETNPVFAGLPEKFSAPHLHSDYITELPKVGETVETSSGKIKVTRAEKLAIRRGYLDSEGLKDTDKEFIQASIIEFDNGAKLYQIQPHPEMATADKANFLVRQNPWIAKEMGDKYYEQAKIIPSTADFSVSKVITNFIEETRAYLEKKQQVTFLRSAIAQNLDELAPYLLP